MTVVGSFQILIVGLCSRDLCVSGDREVFDSRQGRRCQGGRVRGDDVKCWCPGIAANVS